MIVKENGSGIKVPAGAHAARCSGLFDLGTQSGQFGAKRQLVLRFEITDETIPDGDHAGERYQVSRFFSASIAPLSKLRPFLESWRGKAFTPEEAKAFDLQKLINAPCILTIGQDEKDRSAILGISPVRKGEKVEALVSEPLHIDLSAWTATSDIALAQAPEFVRKRILASPEYQALQKQAPESWSGDGITDDDIPF